MKTLGELHQDVYELKVSINVLRNVCVQLANQIDQVERNWNDLRNDINLFESDNDPA